MDKRVAPDHTSFPPVYGGYAVCVFRRCDIFIFPTFILADTVIQVAPSLLDMGDRVLDISAIRDTGKASGDMRSTGIF